MVQNVVDIMLNQIPVFSTSFKFHPVFKMNMNINCLLLSASLSTSIEDTDYPKKICITAAVLGSSSWAYLTTSICMHISNNQ